jgi:hypothetical protein
MPVDHDARTGRREGFRDSAADVAARACNQRDATIEAE